MSMFMFELAIGQFDIPFSIFPMPLWQNRKHVNFYGNKIKYSSSLFKSTKIDTSVRMAEILVIVLYSLEVDSAKHALIKRNVEKI